MQIALARPGHSFSFGSPLNNPMKFGPSDMQFEERTGTRKHMANLDRIKHGPTDERVSEQVLSRWSPRAFSDQPISNRDLRTIFTAATWAASSRNEQPWRFLLGIDPGETYKKIFEVLLPANQSWAEKAPVLYASFAKQTFTHNGEQNGSALHDVGAASATLSLEATRLGIYTHGMAGFNAEKLRESFQVPSDYMPVACWVLGYLGDPSALPERYRNAEMEPRSRKPLSEVLLAGWNTPAPLT